MIALGLAPAAGALTLPFTTPDPGAGVESHALHVQALALLPSGTLVLGEKRVATLLDAAF